jgi:hypothetical protein
MDATDRKTMAYRNAAGELRWFQLTDARRWAGNTVRRGSLFRVGEDWVVSEDLPALLGEPAKAVDDASALEWLLVNGYDPPAELMEIALRLQVK